MPVPPMNDFDDYKLGGTQVSSLWLNGVKIWPSGCPVFAGDGLPGSDITMSLDGSEIYVGPSREWNIYSWPALSLTGSGTITGGDLADWTVDSISWAKVIIDGTMWVISAGYDTTLVVQDYHGFIASVAPDDSTGASTQIVLELSDFGSTYTILNWRATWHPADPDGLWFLERRDDDLRLRRYDISTTALTNVVTGMDVSDSLGAAIMQYDGGLVWATKATGSDWLLHAYDLGSTVHATASSTEQLSAVGWSSRRGYVGTGATLQTFGLVGAVAFTGPGATSCAAFDGGGYDADPENWFAPESRDVVYVSDNFAWFEIP